MCAPDSSKSLETYEACISSVTKVLREGRQGGAKDFHISRDPNVELGVMSTDEKDTEDLDGMYGPLCWQGYDQDPGGVKKLMWHGIMKEFNCKASSTWSRCGRTRVMSYMHKHWSKKRKRRRRIFFLGPKRPVHFFLFPSGFFVCVLPPVSSHRWGSDPTLPTTSHHCATLLVFTPRRRRNRLDGNQRQTSKQSNSREKCWRRTTTRRRMIWLRYKRPSRLPLVQWHITRKRKERKLRRVRRRSECGRKPLQSAQQRSRGKQQSSGKTTFLIKNGRRDNIPPNAPRKVGGVEICGVYVWIYTDAVLCDGQRRQHEDLRQMFANIMECVSWV